MAPPLERLFCFKLSFVSSKVKDVFSKIFVITKKFKIKFPIWIVHFNFQSSFDDIFLHLVWCGGKGGSTRKIHFSLYFWTDRDSSWEFILHSGKKSTYFVLHILDQFDDPSISSTTSVDFLFYSPSNPEIIIPTNRFAELPIPYVFLRISHRDYQSLRKYYGIKLLVKRVHWPVKRWKTSSTATFTFISSTLSMFFLI